MSEQTYVEVFGDDDEVTFQLRAEPSATPHEFHLSSTSGEISLNATSRTDIQVWLEVDGGSSEEKIVTASWDGHRLDVAPAKGSGLGRVLRRNAGFDVRVEVPQSLMPRYGGPGIVARLHSAAGELTVGEVAGDIRLGSASGGLSLARIDGQVECETASGEIDLERVRGRLKVSTVSGDVSLSETILDRWDIKTVSGGVSGEVVLSGAGPYRLTTVSGDTELMFGLLSGEGQPDTFLVESSSMSGDVEIEGTSRKLGRRRWQIGSGATPAGTIRLTSVSGDTSLTVDSSSIDGDFRAAGGRWSGQPWDGITDPDGESGDDADGRTGKADYDLGSRIEEQVNRAVGKVDWVDINASVHNAIDTAFGRPRSAPTPPTPPSAPATPAPPASPATPATPSASTPPTPPSMGKDDLVDGPDEPEMTTDRPMTEEERRLDILRRIERGELSVEDGMAQLDAPAGPGQNRA